MITYETARKLKDAGFIQRTSDYSTHYIVGMKNSYDEPMIMLYKEYIESGHDHELLYIPEFNEMANFLGNNFWSVENRQGGVYAARGSGYHLLPPPNLKAHSPEDAIAKLWIAANYKGFK